MKVAFLNSALVVILLSALVAGAQGQDTQSSSSQPGGAQPQNEPAQPGQNTPPQESPRDQQQTQPPAEAPSTAPAQSEPAPPNQAAPDQGQSKEQGTQQVVPSTQAPPDQTLQPKHPATKSKSTRKKRAASKSQSTDQSGKVVVRNGGLRESTTQISPGGNDQQAQSQRNVTSQLLATTDANLKKVSGHQLTEAQQSMLDQVNAYVRQSKAASDAGDIPRAHTLAVKAQLLSNELARK